MTTLEAEAVIAEAEHLFFGGCHNIIK